MDNSATTPVDPRVVEAMLPYLTEKFGSGLFLGGVDYVFNWVIENTLLR